MIAYEIEGQLVELRMHEGSLVQPPDCIVASGVIRYNNGVKVEFPIRARDLPGWLERFGTKVWSEWCLNVDIGRSSSTRVGDRIPLTGLSAITKKYF